MKRESPLVWMVWDVWKVWKVWEVWISRGERRERGDEAGGFFDHGRHGNPLRGTRKALGKRVFETANDGHVAE